jgi:hypothetical protein
VKLLAIDGHGPQLNSHLSVVEKVETNLFGKALLSYFPYGEQLRSLGIFLLARECTSALSSIGNLDLPRDGACPSPDERCNACEHRFGTLSTRELPLSL